MGLLDRSYPDPDDFHASMRMTNPEAGHTVVGHVLRATAQTLPLVALSAVVIGGELAREGATVAREKIGRMGEAMRRFAQEMGDGSEDPVTTVTRARSGAMLDALGASDWVAVDHHLKVIKNNARGRNIVSEQPISYQRRRK